MRVSPVLFALVVVFSPRNAAAAPEHEGGPPSGATGPGDVSRPATGAPAVPRAPGVPVTTKRIESDTEPLGLFRIMESLIAASGQDPSGTFPVRLGGDALFESVLMTEARPKASGFDLVPLPDVAYSRNEGFTRGAIVPIFVRDSNGEVDRVLAPLVTYNPIFGVEAGAHALAYWDGIELALGAVVSSRVARDLYAEATCESLLETRFALEAFAKNEVDPASRFYGFGPATRGDDETNDTHRETVFRLNVGATVAPGLQVFWRQRFRDVKIGGGRISRLPSTPDVFPDAPGIPFATIDGNGVELRWDRRDEAFLPREGFLVGMVGEIDCTLRGKTTRYYPRLLADLRGYVTPFDGIVTLAARVRFEHLTGSRVPFYEQAILGGRSSLRAYGEDRFTDLASALFQVEARVTVLDTELMGARTIWQVVPFFDEGRVFHSLGSKLFRLWRWSPGVGFRLAVPPNIVGRLDVGVGQEGAAVFVGVGLPY